MSNKFNSYIGKAGQLYAMSEFLMRGWNVAIPEVDEGEDIFVVSSREGTLMRVQVKTSTLTPTRKGYSAAFSARKNMLLSQDSTRIHFLFIGREQLNWKMPLIIPQDKLLDLVHRNRIDLSKGKNISFYFRYSGNHVFYGEQDISSFSADFSDFPIIPH